MTFGERFGYLVWLRHLTDGHAPTNEDIGRAVGRTGVSVGAWFDKEKAPDGRDLDDPLDVYFNGAGKWLLSGQGEPPRPELLVAWEAARQGPTEPILAPVARPAQSPSRAARAAEPPKARRRGNQ